jgi:DNA replication and repair protein RecF
MAVTRLVLTDFRNHRDAVLAPGTGFVVLTGENGAGKTNVLEAVSLLAPGRGLRRAPLGEMVRQGAASGFGVAATLKAPPLQGRGWGWGLSASDAPEALPHPNSSPEGEGLTEIGTGTQPDAPSAGWCGSTARRRRPRRSPNG